MTKNWMLVEYSSGERQYCHYNSNKYYVFENFYLMPEASFDEGVTLGDIRILEENIPHDVVAEYLAKKFKLESNKVAQILSKYDNVYWVPKGTLIEDWVVDKDGYIWYDETGLLGVQKVYSTAKKASESLERYVKQCL